MVAVGQKVKKGEILADGAATYHGELALGRNVLVGFMAWDGYNFEDAIILNERIVKEDVYTSIHIEEFEIEIRETKLGREEFTRDIPNVSEKALRNLDENGIIRIGTYCKPGDILVGKVAPKSKSELTPEEKLLHAIFGRAGEDVKNDSLEVPSGVEGIVINTQRFSRRMSLSEEERKVFEKELKDTEAAENQKVADEYKGLVKALEEALGGPVTDPSTGKAFGRSKDAKELAEESERFKLDALDLRGGKAAEEARKLVRLHAPRIEAMRDERDRKLNSLKRGDELPSGVLQMVKIYIATKRVISVGDKMAGRHGNKGVIAKILPEEDMPFLADGTAVEILLNPAGRPVAHERRPDPGDPPGLGRGQARVPGGLPGVRRRRRVHHPPVPEGRRPARERQGRAVRRPHRRQVRPARDGRLPLHAEAPPPGGRQDPRPRHGALLA